MHWGGRGKLRSLFLRSPFQERPWGTERESDPPEGWIRRSTALGVCAVQTPGRTGFLWDLGWVVGEGDGAGEPLCSPPS